MASITQHTYPMFPRPNNEPDFMLFPEHQAHTPFASPPLEMQYNPDGYAFPQASGYETNMMYSEAPFSYNSRASPVDGEFHVPSSRFSNSSAPSASSSPEGSPLPNAGQLSFIPDYHHNALGVNPSIVGHADYFAGTEYSLTAPGMDEFNMAYESKPGFVDPSLIHPEIRGPMAPPMTGYDQSNAFSPQANVYPHSPALSGQASPVPCIRNGSSSPYVPGYQYSPFTVPAQDARRPSLSSYQSHGSLEHSYSGDESKEKQRCPHPDCGKVFKDLKAHMLTHQTERPEKCPIQTCDYHVKGFARKYDKNRHTLTHYKGTMVCGFCPGSGSAAEKSFNRADVFKRHLTAVHGVEQTPPNSRKKTASTANTGKTLTGYAPDATGKCSTCSSTFSNAQDFYEHLDDCVLRIVQQEDPSEAVNARRLAEVQNDAEVHETLEKNQLPIATQTLSVSEDEDEEDTFAEDSDRVDEDLKASRKPLSPASRKKGNPANGVQKSRGMTHSRGSFAQPPKAKGRKSRKDYPSSWGFDKGQMTVKKRVMTVFDGPRRLAKDEMMLSMENEVRVKLADGKSYVTDLDVETLNRAQGFLSATAEEKGIWISDDPTEEDMRKMLEFARQ